MPSIISAGTLAESAATVVDPTALAPGLPTRSTGDWMFCVTACASPTPTVATPAGWQSVYNVTGTNARLALFVRVTDGSETAPTVTWSGLVTGASGNPCMARIVNLGTGFMVIGGLLQTDVLGAVQNLAATATTVAGGTGITTVADADLLFGHGVFLDDTITSQASAGTGVVWTDVLNHPSTSGSDMRMLWAWATKSPPGAVGDHTWTLTGATAFASSGVMVAIKPIPPPTDVVPVLTLRRSRVRHRTIATG